MNQGVLKTVTDAEPPLLYAECEKRDARWGPEDKALVAAKERILHMTRLILGSVNRRPHSG